MSTFDRNSNRPRPRGNVTARQHALKPKGELDLFPIAVFIMGVVSCYTTAVGLYPMLGNWILSYATAFALSVFMVAIALRIPKAYENGSQYKLIAGYIFVAMFSVLLNFNAIYGVFSAEKLLYEELKQNKSELTAIRTRAIESLDGHFGAVETEQKLKEAQALLKEETTNRVDPGYGQNARRINQESVIPLQAKLVAIRTKYDPTVGIIDSVVAKAQSTITLALENKTIPLYREAVDQSIDAYSQVGEMTQNLIGSENFSFEALSFQHRDVGNLNHSLWTLGNIPKLEAKQASSVIVSLLLSLLIDFIVLFVLVMINRPGKGDLNGPEKSEAEEAETILEEEYVSPRYQNIYATRSHRRSNAQSQEMNRRQINGNPWKVEEDPKPEPINPVVAPVSVMTDTEERETDAIPAQEEEMASEVTATDPTASKVMAEEPEADVSPAHEPREEFFAVDMSQDPPSWYLPEEKEGSDTESEEEMFDQTPTLADEPEASEEERSELAADEKSHSALRSRSFPVNGHRVSLP